MTKKDNVPKKKKHHKIRSLIYRTVLILIAGLTVGISFYSWNAKKNFNNQLPMPFGFGASVVLSPSMDPTLKVNDLVFVTAEDEYQVGDIVVYQDESTLVIHRIISIDGDMIRTKGDANNTPDLDPITVDDIKGKYTFRIPFVGFIFRWLKTLPGTLCVVALVVFLMYRSRRKERKNGEEELEKIVAEIRTLQAQQSAAGDEAADSADAASSDEPVSEADPATDEAEAVADETEEQTVESPDSPSEPPVHDEADDDSAAEDVSAEDELPPDESSEAEAVSSADTDTVVETAAEDTSSDTEISELNQLLSNLEQ